MFCPNCGQRQVSNESRFCPACGFPLETVGELLANGGRLSWRPPQPAGPVELSPRQKGIRQGAMVMLTTLLVVPLLAIFGVAMLGFPGELVALAAVGLPVGGFLRIIYALLYESNAPAFPAAPQPSYVPPPAIPNYLGSPPQQSHALPPRQAAPIPAPARPQRYNTGELVEPPRASVTDHTTRLLDKQPEEPTRMLDRQPDDPSRQ
ncbi:MAG: zinc ribbon domain-containing protein [Pyrinomonadaceae bacterium]